MGILLLIGIVPLVVRGIQAGASLQSIASKSRFYQVLTIDGIVKGLPEFGIGEGCLHVVDHDLG